MYSCPKTSTWTALKWMKQRGRWNISKGFAWILHGRPANGFPSTGQTLVWRKLRLLHIEGVSEWLSGHNQYLNSYTNPHVSPLPCPSLYLHPAVILPELLSCCAQITPTLPCFVLVAVWFQHRPIWTDRPAELKTKMKIKWHKKNHKMLLHIWLIFLACLCAFSLSWAFLLTEKAMVWNYFLILAYL